MRASQMVTPEGRASPQSACNQDGAGGPQSGSFCPWVGRSELWLPRTPEETVLTKEVEADVREQAFWKVLGTPDHVAEQLLVASLGGCFINVVSVCLSGVQRPKGSVPTARVYSWMAY